MIGQAASIVRDLFIAGQVGLSPELDALLIAWGVPTALAAILSSGTSAALVPAFVETRLNLGLVPARRLAGAVALWATAGTGVLAAVIFVAADPIVSIVGIGLSEPDRAVAATYLRMMVPIGVIACLQHILLAVSQAEGRFATMAASNLAQPVTTLAVVLALWHWTGLTAVALAFLLGPLASLLVLLVDGVRSSTIPIPSLVPRGVGIRDLVRHASPLTLSAALLPLNVIVDRAIASLVTPGAVSALRYAETLVRTPISAIGPAWGSALYPALVRTARDGASAIGESTGVAIRYATAVFVPLSVLLMALAPLVVEVIYGRGAFDAEAAALTTGAVAGYAPLVAALMITPVLTNAHNAMQRGYVLLATGILNVTLNLTLNVLLAAWLGVAGVAASSSITAVILIFFLVSRMRELRAAHQLRTMVRNPDSFADGGNGSRGGGWAGGVDRNPDAPRSARSHRSLRLGICLRRQLVGNRHGAAPARARHPVGRHRPDGGSRIGAGASELTTALATRARSQRSQRESFARPASSW